MHLQSRAPRMTPSQVCRPQFAIFNRLSLQHECTSQYGFRLKAAVNDRKSATKSSMWRERGMGVTARIAQMARHISSYCACGQDDRLQQRTSSERGRSISWNFNKRVIRRIEAGNRCASITAPSSRIQTQSDGGVYCILYRNKLI